MQDIMFEVKNKTFSRGGHLLANLVPMLEQKSNMAEYFSRARQCVVREGNTFCRNGSVFQGSQNSKAVKKDNFSENTACEKGRFHKNSEHIVKGPFVDPEVEICIFIYIIYLATKILHGPILCCALRNVVQQKGKSVRSIIFYFRQF